ncbi:MAG TPA: GNAT family protein [Flavisolibacter sp.]|jgi:RimJ/RimL family protein N-acetyltransferase|nr:GNAT family protein [Flavisolibacter sp.]
MTFSFTKEIILENSRVLLRPLQPGDVENLLPVATAQSDLVQYSPYEIHTPDLLAAYINHSLAERAACSRFPFIVFDKRAASYAGSTSIANVSNKDQRLEIGWTWIGRNFQMTGLNRACKFLLLSYAFEELEFERVEFKTDARNQASRTAIEKIGGQYEGTLRSHTVMLDGFRRDTVYYSILKPEWPGLKQTVFKEWIDSSVTTGMDK